FRRGKDLYLQSKSGQPLARYFPDIVVALSQLAAKKFVLDGELVIDVGGQFSFDELQLRLHPAASRVQKLAAAHPATFIVFDLLENDASKSLLKLPLRERRTALETFAAKTFKSAPAIKLSPETLQEAQVVGVQSAPGSGSQSTRKSWSKSLTIILPAIVFGMVQRSLDGERTKRRGNALSTNWLIAKAASSRCCNSVTGG